jgi:hypothetical protein
MAGEPTWIVQLFIDGPIATQDVIWFQHPKGFSRTRQFYSDLRFNSTPAGLRASVTAYARNSDLARKAALVFVGEMLDILALDLGLPVKLSLYDARAAGHDSYSVKRAITEIDLRKFFRHARWFSEQERTFLRALSWFRKGLTTEDPLDRFLALWLAIEVVAGKYHPQLPADHGHGSKSQIWESFKSVWGEYAQWPEIAGQRMWIDENYKLHKQIAHGTAPVDIEAVEAAVAKATVIQNVARNFLLAWRDQHFAPMLPLLNTPSNPVLQPMPLR